MIHPTHSWPTWRRRWGHHTGYW